MGELRRWIKPATIDLFGVVRYKEPRPWPRRLRCAWAVLRGRPVAYRIHVNGSIDIPAGATGGCITECTVDGAGQADLHGPETDLSVAMQLLDEMFSQPLPADWETRARELLVRHKIREA